MRTLGFISLVAASGHHRTKPKEVRGPKPPYTGAAWSRVYRIYYGKSRRLSFSSSGRKARYLSYIQNSYASVHSFGTPSITLYSVISPSCPVLFTASVVVTIGPAGNVPTGRGNAYGAVRSV